MDTLNPETPDLDMKTPTMKLVNYIEQMSHEMLNMAKAAELSDIVQALGHVEETIQKTYPPDAQC